MKKSNKITKTDLKKLGIIGLAAVLPAGICAVSCGKKAQKDAKIATEATTTEDFVENTEVIEVTEDGKIKLKPLPETDLNDRQISLDPTVDEKGKGVNGGGAGAAGSGTKVTIEAQDPHVSNGNNGQGGEQKTTRTEIIPEETTTSEPKPVDYPTTEEKTEKPTEKVIIITTEEKTDPTPKQDQTTEQKEEQTSEKETIIIEEDETVEPYTGDYIDENDYSSKNNNVKKLTLHM